MSSINTMRAILVAGAAFAALLAALYGEWLAVGVLGVGLVAHGLMWWYLYRLGVDSPDG
ncbi:MAG: hypothetical protein ACR2MA_08730 [Egibacteraceae bacterium]